MEYMDIVCGVLDEHAERALRALYPDFQFEQHNFHGVLTYQPADGRFGEITTIIFYGYGLIKNGVRRTSRTFAYSPEKVLDMDDVLWSIQNILDELESTTW